MGNCQLETGDRELPARAARAKDYLFCLKPQPALRFDDVRTVKSCSTGPFLDGDSRGIDLRPQQRMCAHITHDFVYTREQPRVLQHRLSHINTVLTELTGFSDQPCSMGQCSDRNRSVMGRHASKLVASHEHSTRAQVCCTKRCEHSCRPSSNN